MTRAVKSSKPARTTSSAKKKPGTKLSKPPAAKPVKPSNGVAKKPTTKTAAKRQVAAAKPKPKTVKPKPATPRSKTTTTKQKVKTAPAPKRKVTATPVAKKVEVKAARRKVAPKNAVTKAPVPKTAPQKKRAAKRAPVIDAAEVIKEFRSVVNLTADELERRLSRPESRKLGVRDTPQIGIAGHDSGRRILEILAKRRSQYTDADIQHMQTVVWYVRRRKTERPPGDIFASNWRYSLMNWGHDPMKRRR